MDWKEEALSKAFNKIEKNITAIGEKFPHVAIDGIYDNAGPGFWTAGFWPGLLWLFYRETKEDEALRLAVRLEEAMDGVLDGFVKLHHDVGFMWMPASVAHYKWDGDREARVRGLKAASHLAGRFNLAGNFIRAWNDDINPDSCGWAIIDCTMNLSLLFWASKETGDPRFAHIARAHADMVLKEFVREDHTAAHVVSFDPETGRRIESLGGQGYGPGSVWARGQAWAVYGLAIAARETKDKRYQEEAGKIAEAFMGRLPDDFIPIWDFAAPEELAYGKDSSAAACMASGLLELAFLEEQAERRAYYRELAVKLLKGLYEGCSDFTEGHQGMIGMGTVNFPKNRHINVPIIYGDYFFVEALIKLKHETGIF